jgi:hypothetical protein
MCTGEEEGLHILSPFTAAGDEMGYEFIEMVMNSQSSISSFCTMKAASYYGSKVRFMSRQTFTEWIFSWLVNFRVDFREVCSHCGSNPKVLAGDGTKLGLFFQHSKSEPIEKPDCDLRVPPVHRRNERQFFSYSARDDGPGRKQEMTIARHCLHFFVAKNYNKLDVFKKTNDYKVISGLSDQEKKDKLLSVLAHQLHHPICSYIDLSFDQELVKALNPVLEVCATEAPLTSLINFRLIQRLSDVTSDCGAQSINVVHEDLPEIFSFYKVANSFNEGESINVLIKYIIEKIKTVHKDDKETESADAVIRPYNPEVQGRAYYFTEHGGQLRHMPTYVMTEN